MESLRLPYAPLSLSSHPTEPLLSISTTTTLHLALAPPNQSPKIVHTTSLSTQTSAFHDDTLLTAVGTTIHTFNTNSNTPGKRHSLPDSAASVTAIAPYTRTTFLCGDSEGGLHHLDTRCARVVSTLQQGDYITAIQPVPNHRADSILVTSGDGTLCAYDVRHPIGVTLMYATDSYNDDLLSLAVLEKYAVAGTLSGALNVYDLRFLGSDNSDVRVDRFFGHPECVNAVLAWDDCVITASSDGYVRVVDVCGRRLLGLLEYDMQRVEGGKRKDTWPVEGMVKVTGWGKPVFALMGHDEDIRFCDGGALVDEEDGLEGAVLKGDVDEEMGKKKKRRKGIDKDSTFFDDL